MQKKKWSLLTRLLIWINCISFVVFLGLASSTMFKMLNGAEKMLAINMDNLVNFAGLAAGDYIWNLNTSVLESTTQQLLQNPSIESVTFFDAKGGVMAKNQRKDSPMAKATEQEKIEKYRTIKIPIIFGDKKETVGFLECIYNLNTVDDVRKDFFKSSLIGTLLAQVFLGLFLFLFLKKTTSVLKITGEKIKVVSEKNQVSSDAVQLISEEVSAATQDQVSSIQETVATLDEISAMITTSVEGAQNSTIKAEESLKLATEGKVVVGRMIQSMEEIDFSNKTIMEEIKKGNEKMSGIVRVIHEITQKTTVINDIVFQTKLLSFNASVEAARAGDQGKGFAVVAEEVGNLAQMSGKASSEISGMLEASINTVNSIIKETNESVQELIKMGNSKVKEGVSIADECGRVLDEVVDIADIVKTMMKEVSVASREQSEGMRNIATAMTKLDQTTLSNYNTSQRSFQSSKELSMQVTELKLTVEELESEIFGTH